MCLFLPFNISFIKGKELNEATKTDLINIAVAEAAVILEAVVIVVIVAVVGVAIQSETKVLEDLREIKRRASAIMNSKKRAKSLTLSLSSPEKCDNLFTVTFYSCNFLLHKCDINNCALKKDKFREISGCIFVPLMFAIIFDLIANCNLRSFRSFVCALSVK